MNTLRITTIFCLALTIVAALPPSLGAALPIDLEVATVPGTPLSAPQEWARALGRMDLGSVRLRGVRGDEQPKLEPRQVGSSTRYRLLAILNRSNELVLPKRRFRYSERAALQKYLKQLPAQAAYHAQQRGRFGLTEKQFRQVYAELSQPIGFSTLGKTPAEIITRTAKTMASPLQRAGTTLRNGTPLTIELRSFSTGTALAYVLRTAGLALYPEQLPGKELNLTIATYDTSREAWPVGWKPAVSSRQSAPQLYERRNIEIAGFSLTQTLDALQPALKIPVVMDRWILEQQQLDPSKIQVTLAKKRTFLKSALGKLLSQAKLAEEVRVDELEQPFLWITRFGKNSPTATQ
ncbi:MAG: hypothetical protein ACR2NM_05595 [Bythopirellula sp.]